MNDISILIIIICITTFLFSCVFCFFKFCCSIIFNREILIGIDNLGNRIRISRNIHTYQQYIVTDYFVDNDLAKPYTIENNDDPEKECVICLEKIGETECKLNCGHSYHLKCIREWAHVQRKNTCPQCRQNIIELDSIV